MDISEHELGWVAGVLDLKGRVIVKKNKQRRADNPQTLLVVDSKELLVIKELSRMTGTNPQPHNQRPLSESVRRSCSEHCPAAHIHVELDMPSISRWTVTGCSMVVVLFNTLPFMRKADQFRPHMEFVLSNSVLEGQGSGATLKSLSRLYEMGWQFPPELPMDKVLAHMYRELQKQASTTALA